MPKSILAPLTGFSTDRAILETAAAAARVEGGHIACVYRRIDDLESAATMKLGFPKLHETMSVTIERINKEQSARLAHARTAFDDFVRRHGIAVQNPPDKDVPVSASWEELDSELSGEARYHDMVVMAKDDELSSQQIKSVLVQAGRPLILAPAKPAGVIGRNVAIAWKPGAEAARAVTAASSLLARAEK
ncbi:MAG TPA: hypothetical protein VG501_00730, partial [Rhizomicrobium sp.]|nr:hypothetical protein [Rhizomicrobium sp.]